MPGSARTAASRSISALPPPAAIELKPGSTVEIREVPTRYVFIDGKPLRQPLDEPTAPLEGQPRPR